MSSLRGLLVKCFKTYNPIHWGGGGGRGGGREWKEGDSNQKKKIGIRLFFVLMLYITFQVPG